MTPLGFIDTVVGQLPWGVQVYDPVPPDAVKAYENGVPMLTLTDALPAVRG